MQAAEQHRVLLEEQAGAHAQRQGDQDLPVEVEFAEHRAVLSVSWRFGPGSSGKSTGPGPDAQRSFCITPRVAFSPQGVRMWRVDKVPGDLVASTIFQGV